MTLTCVLEDGTGDMTPSNPTGLYYGVLGQYTPVRLALRVVVDGFNRTSSNGWSDSPSDGAWTTNGGAAGDYAINGTQGTHATSGSGQRRRTWLASTSALRNCEVRVRLPGMTAPGSSTVYRSIMLRGTSATSYAAVDCALTSAGSVQVGMRASDDNTFLVAPFAVGTLTAGHVWVLAAQVDGHTVRGKLWDETAGPEPYDWQFSYVDDGFISSIPAAGPAGWTGLRSSSSSSSSHTYLYDDFEVRQLLFFGEASEFRPEWDEGHRNRIVAFQAADLSQRMGDAAKRLARSAVERYVLHNAIQPVVYWPMDDGGLSLSGRVAVGVAQDALLFDGNFPVGAVRFPLGTGELAPWLKPGAEIKNSPVARFGGMASPVATGSGWTVHMALNYSGGRYSTNSNSDGLFTGGSTTLGGDWTISFLSFTYQIDVAPPGGGASVGTVTIPEFYDQKVHHLGFRSKQDGADVDWSLWVDGTVVLSGTLSAATNPGNTGADYAQNGHDEDSRVRVIGHVAVYSGDGPDPAEWAQAVLGHPGERAGLRAQRVCAEEGIPFTWVGLADASDDALSQTAPMGPQYHDTVLDVLNECADTEQGKLLSARGAPGFVFVTRAGLTQDVRMTVDYSAEQVARPFAPVRDGKDVVNLVTVRRRTGGTLTLEQVTGPLNTGDPGGADPDAAGVKGRAVDVNPASDAQLADVGQLELTKGTIPGDRYPKITIDLRAPGVSDAAFQYALLSLDAFERLVVSNAQAAKVFDPIDQLTRGAAHVITNARAHSVTFDASPYSPYDVFVLDSDRLYGDSSTLAASATAGLSLPYTLSVATSSGPLWTTAAGDFPQDVVVAGQRLTLSGISGASSPQTFTVSARANGVDKAQVAGAKVTIADPAVLG
jgi:hypothetical protein